MIAVPRLTRAAGVFAAGLAALVAGTAQASAACTLTFSPGSSTAGSILTIMASGTGDDLRNTSVVTVGGNGATIQSVSQTVVTVTIPTKTIPRIDSAVRTNFLFGGSSAYGSTGGNDAMTITGANFSPTVSVGITGSTNCDGSFGNKFTYSNGSVTEVDVGGTKAPSFSVNSDSNITLTTPPGITGVTSVLVVAGTQISTGGDNIFAYVGGGPSVSGVGPQIGLTTIAQSITISGQNFVPGTFSARAAAPFASQPATSVNFPCVGSTTTAATTPTVVNTGEIDIAKSPTCNTTTGGVVNVTVTTPVGSSSGQYQWVVSGQPHVTSITPNGGAVGPPISGTTAGGTPVAIAGNNFIGTTKVTFGTVDVTAGITVTSAGQINIQTPPQSAAGAVVVSVTVDDGSGTLKTSPETNVTFNYILPAPVINTMTPNNGSTAGATSIQIFGQFFTAATAVSIGGTNVTSFRVVSDTEIDAVTAAHTSATGLSVQVTTSSGTNAANNLYTYGTPPPTVSSVSPNTGGISGGQTVTITGTFFAGVTGVKFGGATATNLGAPSCDATTNVCTVTAVTPMHSAGVVDVAVTTSIGTGIGTSLYSYSSSPPTVTGISPATGSTLGGTNVTIRGTNFTGTPQVTINNVAASQVTVVNSTTISAVTPAGTGSNVPVIVKTSFGDSTAANIYSYVVPVAPTQPAPTVTGVSPSSGTTQGLTPVTISGTNLTGATSVTFGGSIATKVVVVDANTITALTPAGTAGTVVDIVVTTPATATTTQTATLPGAYTYVVTAPTVTAVVANTGSILGGTVVTINGTNLTGATAVTFGGNAATSFTVLTATTIVATTPPGTAGAVDVAVTTAAGTGTGIKLFTYVGQSPPTVTGISPSSGNTAGGTQVQITGTNFGGATSVTIGGNPATFVTVVSPTQINATTPAHAAPGAVDVVVTTPAGTGTGTKLYTYVAGAPTVTAISPVSGPIAGGTAVTITGTNFTGATSITIGGVAPTAVTVVSPTSITATTPAHAAGAVNVVVTTPVGTGTGTNLFTYTAPVSVLPTVTSVSPNTGIPGGGTTVTITGTNFTSATAVTFGGANATFFTIVSATSITARSPAGSGTVHVTVTTAAGTSATGANDQFSYAKAATSLDLTSSPNPSNVGQPVTFTVRITGNSPTGMVTFTDNGRTIGTATLVNGVATFTTSTLAAGSNSVTANYPGDVNNAPDPETVTQVVNAISDSVKLRQMQMAAMPVVTNMSGQAISGAIDNAVSNGFGGGCQMVSPNGGGFTYCFDGGAAPMQQSSLAQDGSHILPEQRQMLEEDFKALGYAEDPAATRKAPTAAPREWLVWIDVRGADFSRTTVGSDMAGKQVNGTAGITHMFTPDFLVGVLGGYEHFDFTSQAYSGKLTGDGYTAGGYVGWRLASVLRFDASGAWSNISAVDSAGTASGNFTGHRWFASAGVTGTYDWAATVFEPSARVYMLWEQENAYTDSLGTLQASHTFDTGRGSVGMKVSHLFPVGFGSLAPYLGLYGDYYFSKDDATTTPSLTAVTPLLKGGAARGTGGITMMFGGGAQLGVGGEYSGLGQDTRIWNLKLHGSVPF